MSLIFKTPKSENLTSAASKIPKKLYRQDIQKEVS